MTEVAAAVDEAGEELARIEGELSHLERQIATATWEAAELEADDGNPAELDAMYAKLALWRSRLGALLVAKEEAKRKVSRQAAERLASANEQIRGALQPIADRQAETLEAAVSAAKAFAAKLRDLTKAETERKAAYERVSPNRFSGGQQDIEAMRAVRAILPTTAVHEEPLYEAVMSAAMAPVHERPFWRVRADYLASKEAA